MADTPGLSLASQNGSVRLTRDEAVGDDFWLALRAELGGGGVFSRRTLTLPLERFLARRGDIGRLCKAHRVGIDLDDRSRGLIATANDERKVLRTALTEPSPLSADELEGRLAGSRFIRDLRPFQERDLQSMLGLAHDADFSVPGAGKTTKSYAVYEAERHAGKIERLLVIAPLSAFDSWIGEAELSLNPPPVVQRFEGTIDAATEVLLVNYHRLASNYEVIARWVAGAPTQVVLDEAHRMKKGWVGEWGRACLSIAYLAQRRQVLTGTPAPQGPRDLVAIVDFLWPNQALRVLPADALQPTPPPDAGHMVAEAIRPLFVRTRKSELGLPRVDYRAVSVPLRPLHGQVYAALKDQYAGKFRLNRRDRMDLIAMNKVVMYMLEAATNPKLLAAGSTDGDPEEFRHPPLDIPPDSPLADLIRDYNLYERPRKFEELGVLIQENAKNGLKTLVWSNFVRNLRTLERELARYEPALVHGAVPAFLPEPTEIRTREKEIRRFRTDDNCMVLLANPQAMSEGISLHIECHDAIWLDRTYNAGQYLQGVDRIHRLGLKPHQETRITFLISEGTIDESVDERVALKAKRLGDMLDDPDIATMALPNDEDYGSAIDSARDVDALFKHLRGEDE